MVQTWTGAEAKHLRQALRLTIEGFAEKLGVNRRTVDKWEARGEHLTPRPDMQAMLDTALTRADASERERFWRGVTGVSESPLTSTSLAPLLGRLGRRHDSVSPASRGEAATDQADRLSYILAHPSSIDLVTVAHLRQRVQELDQRYDQVPSTSLLADAGQCLGLVGFLSANATSTAAPSTITTRGRIRRELYAVEAEAATLMGQLVWDASQRRDHQTATMYFDQAIVAARRLRDPTAEGFALLRKSYVALYGERDPHAGLQLTTQTAETTKNNSRVVAGLAFLHMAEAHAMLGDVTPCEKALGQAGEAFCEIDDADPAIDLYSPTHAGRLAGSCYLFLDDPTRAQPILEQTAGVLHARSKSRAIVLGNLTLASIRQNNLDEAAARLHEAIDVIELNWGGGGLNVVFGAAKELRPWRSEPVVHDAYDRLLGLMTAV
ncbi:MAG: helix-turn-helix domain-containing protein [Nocardioides sp.]